METRHSARMLSLEPKSGSPVPNYVNHTAKSGIARVTVGAWLALLADEFRQFQGTSHFTWKVIKLKQRQPFPTHRERLARVCQASVFTFSSFYSGQSTRALITTLSLASGRTLRAHWSGRTGVSGSAWVAGITGQSRQTVVTQIALETTDNQTRTWK